MPAKNRIWLVGTFAVLILLVILAIGSAVNAVKSMQTVTAVESLEKALRGTEAPIDIAVPTETASAAPSTVPADTTSHSVSAFYALLSELPTDDALTSHPGYNRDYFNAWIDADSDGCNTRAEVLMMESNVAVSTRGTCTVTTGSWYSAYDGSSTTEASGLDIDHFVPLNEAWVSGADTWDAATRVQFGNDLGYDYSLLAVSASSNRSKSDQDPAEWMPAQRDYYCDYVATWISVKWRWGLSVDSLERLALNSVLEQCSGFAIDLPEKANVVTGAPSAEEPVPPSDGVLDPNYGTCSIAQANGAGPYRQGVDPEYDWYRDRDKDGVVCE
ncbi:hypothetical protein M2119_001494 [Aurantimicrobium minutum]|uniref:excalibur calcium-binding domain-containing protein n=1 Tax=Aurantimicrobium minutum TaxID=708131 RepID=UPI002474BF86|nr:excalibur calcium-binding domain-containing protein [Aurantimicrobium minutum]MDH6533257.1 hypothetical protein [Aurantimicrobium minutum]